MRNLSPPNELTTPDPTVIVRKKSGCSYFLRKMVTASQTNETKHPPPPEAGIKKKTKNRANRAIFPT